MVIMIMMMGISGRMGVREVDRESGNIHPSIHPYKSLSPFLSNFM
jgi:hypothetical protein